MAQRNVNCGYRVCFGNCLENNVFRETSQHGTVGITGCAVNCVAVTGCAVNCVAVTGCAVNCVAVTGVL